MSLYYCVATFLNFPSYSLLSYMMVSYFSIFSGTSSSFLTLTPWLIKRKLKKIRRFSISVCYTKSTYLHLYMYTYVQLVFCVLIWSQTFHLCTRYSPSQLFTLAFLLYLLHNCFYPCLPDDFFLPPKKELSIDLQPLWLPASSSSLLDSKTLSKGSLLYLLKSHLPSPFDTILARLFPHNSIIQLL